MVAKRKDEDPYLPPEGWKPKSAFWQAIMAKTEYARTHKTVSIPCPSCGEPIDLHVTSEDDPNKPR